jgi:hypothetical protein
MGFGMSRDILGDVLREMRAASPPKYAELALQV